MYNARHVMLDIETFGTAAGCVVPTVGIYTFFYSQDGNYTELMSREYNISIPDQSKLGLKMQDDTLEWWSRQTNQAQARINKSLLSGLSVRDFCAAFRGAINPENPYIWSNGAAFDIPILERLFHAVGLKAPWSYTRALCFRTIRDLYPSITHPKDPSQAHGALYDAKYQGEYLIKLLRHHFRQG